MPRVYPIIYFFRLASNAFNDDGDDSSPEDSDDSDDMSDDGDHNYLELLDEFAKKWLTVQLRHDVSLAAANEFWKVSISHMRRLLQAKDKQNVTRPIPQFINERNKLYNTMCPPIRMNFAFLHKPTEEIYLVNGANKAPQKYSNDPIFEKLYEVAYIKVCYIKK